MIFVLPLRNSNFYEAIEDIVLHPFEVSVELHVCECMDLQEEVYVDDVQSHPADVPPQFHKNNEVYPAEQEFKDVSIPTMKDSL